MLSFLKKCKPEGEWKFLNYLDLISFYSALTWQNSMDRGAWWATVQGVTNSQSDTTKWLSTIETLSSSYEFSYCLVIWKENSFSFAGIHKWSRRKRLSWQCSTKKHAMFQKSVTILPDYDLRIPPSHRTFSKWMAHQCLLGPQHRWNNIRNTVTAWKNLISDSNCRRPKDNF